MYSEQELRPWVDALHDAVPRLEPFDAHIHVGLSDPAGYQATAEEAVAALSLARSGGLVFTLKEPDGYGAANAAMIALAGEHPGRLRALCRLDPADAPLTEAERSLAAGAVGLKLHPRGEGFELRDRRLDDVFALADRRRLPIMVHAGAGDDAVVPQALDRAQAHPGARLILAHCAVGAFPLAMRRAPDVPNVLFDTAWWNPADVWALLRLAPPGQILFASDVPFAGPGACQLLTGRLALQSGLGPEAVRAIMGGQLRRLMAGDEPLRVAPAAEPPPALPPELERLYVTLCSVVEPMLRGEPAGQGLPLAQAACAEPSGRHAPLLESIATLLKLAGEADEPDALRPLRTPGFDLVLAAAVLARTPDVPVP
jgi:hypothetical protein